MTPELQATRERRAHRTAVARALAAADPGQAVPWEQLHELPAWCLLNDAQRARLALIAGALFAAPGMRLWIDAARLRAARSLIGARLFDAVMASPALPEQAPDLPETDNVERLFGAAGRAVLLGSLSTPWMRGFAAPCLPGAEHDAMPCPANVARALTELALRLLSEPD